MVQLQNITKAFVVNNTKFLALDDVSFEIDKGDIFGIIGQSGAGKSTLIRCINLLERPDTGHVLIDGVDLTTLGEKELQKTREKIGMIFQHFNLFSQRNVFQNVAYPLEFKGYSKKEITSRVLSLLDLVGLSEKATAYPEELSGGQKQRVAIARALAGDPKILLCDEATSALDPETTKSILRLLKEINKKLGVSIILITHQKEVVKEICNKVMILERGKVQEQGDILDLFIEPKSEAGRSFVGDILDEETVKISLEKEFQQTKEPFTILKLTFIGEDASEPFISKASKQNEVEISILFGNIDLIYGQALGGLVVKIVGSTSAIQHTIQYFKDNKVKVKEVAPC